MLQTRSVQFSYGPGSALSFPDLQCSRGETCLLLGNSGSGKTTLLHLVGGLLRASRGEILLDNTNLVPLGEAALDRFRATHIGFVFQKNHLVASLTVQQNLMLAPWLAGRKPTVARAQEVLALLGLEKEMHTNVRRLSYGQAQRVAIARALMNEPSLVLADEPTSALDDLNCERVTRLLFDVTAQTKTALLIATHDHRLKNLVSNQIVLTP